MQKVNDSITILAIAKFKENGKVYYGLGKDNGLVVKSKTDLRWFKFVTDGRKCIVGTKTAEGLPPLPNRQLNIMSRSGKDGTINKEEALKLIKEGAVVIGGKEIYKELGDKTEFLIMTVFENHGKTMKDFDTFLTGAEIVDLIGYRKRVNTLDLGFVGEDKATVEIYAYN